MGFVVEKQFNGIFNQVTIARVPQFQSCQPWPTYAFHELSSPVLSEGEHDAQEA